jgi:hypothetical protein
MDMLEPATILVMLGVALVLAGVAHFMTRTFYGARFREASGRADHVRRNHLEAKVQLAEAQRSLEMLRKELELARCLNATRARPR